MLPFVFTNIISINKKTCIFRRTNDKDYIKKKEGRMVLKNSKRAKESEYLRFFENRNEDYNSNVSQSSRGKNKKKRVTEAAIILMALVVTIIVLLIFAGILLEMI